MPANVRDVRAEAKRLADASPRIQREGYAIVKRGAVEVKKQMRSEARGVAHAPGMPAAISFDMVQTNLSLGFEVGPVKGGAGSLALLYYGNSKTGAVLKDPAFALERQGEETTRRLLSLVAHLA